MSNHLTPIDRIAVKLNEVIEVVNLLLNKGLPPDVISNHTIEPLQLRFPWGEVEVKSTHNGAVIVYNFRLLKELERRGPGYMYLIVRHNGYRETFFHDSVVHFCTLAEVLLAVTGKRTKVPSTIKPHGSNREGYKDGYRTFTLSQIKFWTTGHLTKSSNGVLCKP